MYWQPEQAAGDGFAPLERFVDGRDWCLYDVSRLVSHRNRRHPTGIDRIDLEYLIRLDMRMGSRCVGVCRIGGDFSLLAPLELKALIGALQDRWFAGRYDADLRLRQIEVWGLAPGRWRYGRATSVRGRAAAQIKWAAAAAQISLASIARRARRRRPDSRFLMSLRAADTVYVTCSHFGLARTPRALQRLVDLSQADLLAYVHDIIPIRYPQYQRPESGPELATFLKRLAVMGATFLCNSAATRADFSAWLAEVGARNDAYVAYPPLDYLKDIPPNLAAAPNRNAPYFVCVGTIEPRKNHQLLFKLWREMAAELGSRTPTLILAGSYGWMFDAIKQEIESSGALRPHLTHIENADDAELWSLIKHAAALLFPSHCEGFGLPLIEAQSLGVPCVASDIPVFKELQGDGVTLLPTHDDAAWKAEILRLAAQQSARDRDAHEDRDATAPC